ncbi:MULTISPECIES: enoyl-CoA hydratase/isomerase family protein [unclassified Modicisalibacter]|uniref:enoyl-CoA hydratase/isomerase family protein n=1 Tax=unclassified Modicisalibacter TaxID=2679913 RepID=UPI001CCFBBE7|nr:MULTISPECIES: enoyl-CoA hydratase/isomerase family protein [unclassified Modicisalibacter]MBZ9557033.1 enoyl-CoA hydratase/isomerase family protein [Modicisalibacter sp. R2A 31.J]MBZ9574253.1 enoyl-CoA hydratase/isomerase family protein [Modicisalibacter sp. MOD 31.J]
MTEPLVHFEELTGHGDARLGIARLEAPRSLNALSLSMIERLEAQLEAWEADPVIAAVWLEGSGDKAFCAGGDVVALYHAMKGDAQTPGDDFPTRYFTAEYRLDYRIHTYPKPLVVWGDGIVMGGGLGLMAGGGERVVTETSRIAMPEITIGLYPDIGASWFLNHMPSGVGRYLGLTGAQLNARDALSLGLADRFIPRERRDALIAALREADLSRPAAAVAEVLGRFEHREQAPPGQVLAYFDTLQALADVADVAEAVRRILDDTRDDAWLAANRARLAAGCPVTAHLVWEMQARHRHTSLADAFRDELNLSVQCTRHADLAEGVRALLIDKDKQPRWSHRDVAAVPRADVDDFLAPLWAPEEHPLRAL